MADLRGFGRKIQLTGRAVEENANKLKRQVAVAVDAAVVLATPVDTGRARSNWQVELNRPAGGTVPPLAAGAGAAQASIAKAKARIEQAQQGNEIHITNNLPYIGRLNEGWSAQAPAGFVEQAVLAGADTVKAAKLISKNGNVIGGDLGRIG